MDGIKIACAVIRHHNMQHWINEVKLGNFYLITKHPVTPLQAKLPSFKHRLVASCVHYQPMEVDPVEEGPINALGSNLSSEFCLNRGQNDATKIKAAIDKKPTTNKHRQAQATHPQQGLTPAPPPRQAPCFIIRHQGGKRSAHEAS